MKKISGNQIALTVIASIILTILVVSLVNVGMSIFLERPEYSDYCDVKVAQPLESQTMCEAQGGKWTTYEGRVPESNVTGYCDQDFECRDDYDIAQKSYNQIRYYVFAIIGLALFFVGTSATLATVQYTGLASGAILLLEGIVTNLENKVLVFVSLLIILAIFSYLVYKRIENK